MRKDNVIEPKKPEAVSQGFCCFYGSGNEKVAA
jgi:hypothetical protein